MTAAITIVYSNSEPILDNRDQLRLLPWRGPSSGGDSDGLLFSSGGGLETLLFSALSYSLNADDTVSAIQFVLSVLMVKYLFIL